MDYIANIKDLLADMPAWAKVATIALVIAGGSFYVYFTQEEAGIQLDLKAEQKAEGGGDNNANNTISF